MELVLKECPHCGANAGTVVQSLEVADIYAEGIMDEAQEYCPNFDIEDYKYYYIICNCEKGGCGSLSPWGYTPLEAAQKWNRRPE